MKNNVLQKCFLNLQSDSTFSLNNLLLVTKGKTKPDLSNMDYTKLTD